MGNNTRNTKMARVLATLGATGAAAAASWYASQTCATHGAPHPMDQLWSTIESRRGADPSSSWTAKLLSKGVHKCAQKVGEEATETVIEAVAGNKIGVIKESADLLYHLQVVWAVVGDRSSGRQQDRRDQRVCGLTLPPSSGLGSGR